jgi:hypoxanthine phosphoribosyltransferase
MLGDIDKVLIDRDRIARRVRELGQEISDDLARLGDDAEVMLVPILTGSIIFVADLIRHMPRKMRISLVTVTSYPGQSTRSQGAQLDGDLRDDLTGKHILIVDDVLDSGGTIRLIRQAVEQRRPASVRVCVLLRKRLPAALETPCDYVGFDIPNEFVVGYGLDYDNYYRNLPDVATLRSDRQ